MLTKGCGTALVLLQKYLGDDRFQLALEVGLGLRMQAGPGQGDEQAGRGGGGGGAAEPMQVRRLLGALPVQQGGRLQPCWLAGGGRRPTSRH